MKAAKRQIHAQIQATRQEPHRRPTGGVADPRHPRQKVILDADLAALYRVETRILNQAVRRNMDRFPEDFMFRLSVKEAGSLRSQIVISGVGRIGRGGRRYLPYAFSEHGVVMLSSVLKSARAVQMNIFIARTFVACGKSSPATKTWPPASRTWSAAKMVRPR